MSSLIILECPFSNIIIIIRNIREVASVRCQDIANDIFMILDIPWNVWISRVTREILAGRIFVSPRLFRDTELWTAKSRFRRFTWDTHACRGLFMRAIISRHGNRCLRVYRVCWTYRVSSLAHAVTEKLNDEMIVSISPSRIFNKIINWYLNLTRNYCNYVSRTYVLK